MLLDEKRQDEANNVAITGPGPALGASPADGNNEATSSSPSPPPAAEAQEPPKKKKKKAYAGLFWQFFFVIVERNVQVRVEKR